MAYASEDQMLTMEPMAPTSPDETHSALVVTRDDFSGDIVFAGSVFIDEQLRIGSDPNPWETAWLVWDYTDNQHFYYFALKTSGWELGKVDSSYEGGQRFLATGASIQFATKTWYDFNVEQHVGADATTMTVFIDGQMIVEFTDTEDAYSGGKLGIYSEDARVFVDDVSGAVSDNFDGYDLQSFEDGSQLGTTWDVAFLGYGAGGIVSDDTGSVILIGSNRVDDTLVGGDGNDSLSGLSGDDLLIGGGGADTLDGGAGKNDRAGYDNDGPVLVDVDDTARNSGAAQGDVFVSIEQWSGSAGDDTLLGRDGYGDGLFGQDGDDVIDGRGGRDRLVGGGGSDSLAGGGERDVLYGETGADSFVYRDVSDSGVGKSYRDIIGDFERGIDRIDLSAINADGDGGNGDTAFTFAGTGFSGAGAEVRAYRAGKKAIVELDIDGDLDADAQILVAGVPTLTEGDFFL